MATVGRASTRDNIQNELAMLETTYTPSLDLVHRVTRVLGRPEFLEQLGYPPEPHYRRLWRQAVCALLSGLLVTMLIVAVTSGDRIWPWQLLLISVVAYLSGALAVAYFSEYSNRRFLATLLDTTHLLKISLAEEGVHMEVNSTRSFTPWTVVRKVLLSEEFVLMIREDAVLYVPVSAFPDDEAVLAFTAYASARAREAGQPVDGAPAA